MQEIITLSTSKKQELIDITGPIGEIVKKEKGVKILKGNKIEDLRSGFDHFS